MQLFSRLNLRKKLMLIMIISTLMIFLLQIYYYTNFYVLTESNVELHTSEIMKQVEDRILSFTNDIKDAAIATSFNTNTRKFLSSDDPIYKLSLYNPVMEMMTGIKSSNKNIESIILVDSKKINYGASTPVDYLVLNELAAKNPDQKTPLFGKIYLPADMDQPAFFYSHPSLPSLSRDNQLDSLVNCVVLYKIDYLDRILLDIQATENSLLMILDQENFIISANKSPMKNSFFDESIVREMDARTDNNKVEFQHKPHHVQYKTIAELNLRIVSLIPVNEMTNELREIRNEGLIIGLVMTLLILIMGIIFIRSVTMPFGRIIRFLNFIGNNGGKQRLKMSDTHEMGTIAMEINKMLDKIDETNDKFLQAKTSLYRMEIAKKQAELSYLQSQINPHFLYNTLECIRSIALARGVMEIVEISTSISNIFRYSIKEESEVSLQNEMGCIHDYLRVMSIRYMDKFSTHIHIEDQLLSTRIPKMILQPLVENAIYHGLERKRGKGVLQVKGYVAGGRCLRFEISDDGAGIEESKLAELQQALQETPEEVPVDSAAKGVGILNIHRRIQLEYGEQYGIEISSQWNAGTCVILQFPLQQDVEEQSG